MKRTFLPLLVVVGLLGGCQQYQKQYTQKLLRAHEALGEGTPERAERYLAEAEKIAAKHKVQQTADARILQAETRLALGDLPGALTLAGEVLSEDGCPPDSQARAEEIVGKAAFRQGRFDAAQEHFVSAEHNYESEEDRQRIRDLVQLTRGLVAYGKGDIDVARKYWRTIQDADLRYSVDQNLQNVKTSVAR